MEKKITLYYDAVSGTHHMLSTILVALSNVEARGQGSYQDQQKYHKLSKHNGTCNTS